MVRKAKLKRPKRKAKKVAARTAKANVAQGGDTDVADAAETDGIPERLQTMSSELRALTTHKIVPIPHPYPHPKEPNLQRDHRNR